MPENTVHEKNLGPSDFYEHFFNIDLYRLWIAGKISNWHEIEIT
jgi:hypothetical protein